MGPKKIFGKDKAERKLGEVIFGKNDVEKIKELPKYIQIIISTMIRTHIIVNFNNKRVDRYKRYNKN